LASLTVDLRRQWHKGELTGSRREGVQPPKGQDDSGDDGKDDRNSSDSHFLHYKAESVAQKTEEKLSICGIK
jgi:hypothetical protein